MIRFDVLPDDSTVTCRPADISGYFPCAVAHGGIPAPAIHMVDRWGESRPMCAVHTPFNPTATKGSR